MAGFDCDFTIILRNLNGIIQRSNSKRRILLAHFGVFGLIKPEYGRSDAGLTKVTGRYVLSVEFQRKKDTVHKHESLGITIIYYPIKIKKKTSF